MTQPAPSPAKVETPPTPKLIHAATILVQNAGTVFLFLRLLEPYRYMWFREEKPGVEIETGIWGGSAEEAIQTARSVWRFEDFRTLKCGFRYTLPERDEVGINALFHQMASSYSSMNGVYFDEELGFNCFVQNASLEARQLLERMKK